MKKQRIKPYKKLLYIEDGSVDLNPEIFVIVYRQGTIPPVLVDIKNEGKKV